MSLNQKKTSPRSPILRENTHAVHRARLRLRSRHNVATGHVTDAKVHDRHATKHFTNYKLKYLETYTRVMFLTIYQRVTLSVRTHILIIPAHSSRIGGL